VQHHQLLAAQSGRAPSGGASDHAISCLDGDGC
jgi:hypothetical protein